MSRRVKEFVDIADHVSLDELIEKLAEVRASLPDNAEAELRLRGDDVFGRRITISYIRDQTAGRGASARRATPRLNGTPRPRSSSGFRPNLASSATPRPGKRGKLRIVA